MHSIRILDFLRRFAKNNFSDFKKAIWYEDNTPEKKYLLHIKNGDFSKDDFLLMADETLKIIEFEYKGRYEIQKPNEEVNQWLLKMVKGIVRSELNSN